MGLRTRLLVPLVGLPVASVAVLGAVAYSSGRASLETSLGRMFEVGAARSLSSLDHEVLALYRDAESWAARERMQDILGEDMDGRISSFLVAAVRDEPHVVRALVADAGGRVIAASQGRWLGTRLRPAPPGASAREACRDDPESGTGVLACALPIKASYDERQVLGTLEVAWDLQVVFSRVQTEPGVEGSGPGVVLIRRDGVVVSSPPGSAAMAAGRNLAAAGSRAAARAREGGQGFLVEPIDGVPHLVGYAHSKGPSGWSVIVLETATAAFAPVDRLRGAVALLAGAVALSAAVLSLLLAGRLSGAVRELDEAARRVAAGDLSVRVEPRSDDEIGSLARSFDRMVRDLAAQKAELVDKHYVDSLIAGMSDGLLVVDADGRVERANPALLRRAGLRADEAAGRIAGTLFAEGTDAFDALVREPARRDGAAMAELALRGPGQRPVPVIVSGGGLPGRGLVCVVTDITARKETEEQLVRARQAAEETAAAKARFLAVVSHEVRTPLNGVIGMTDLLAGTALDEKQREYVEVARRSGEALLSVLGDILDYSRMESGRVELARVAFDLPRCLFEVADLLNVPAREKDLEVSVLLDERLPSRVVGDPQRLRQVLLNLGSNAVKFTDAGGVVLRAAPGGGPAVVFSVSDSGPGIPDGHLERIFEPFHQVDATSTRRHGGVGLGLAIARQIVGLMGGRLSVRNEQRGATFTFTAELPPVVEAAAPPPADPSTLAGRRVLVVDDNATNRMVLREMLAAWRCTVDEAVDGWQALETLRSRAAGGDTVDVALVDFQMPEMDGLSLAREIKADPRLAGLPLVLLTSIPQHVGDGVIGEEFAACLTKPLRQAALLGAIAGVLAPRRPGLRAPNVAPFPPRRPTGA